MMEENARKKRIGGHHDLGKYCSSIANDVLDSLKNLPEVIKP